MATAAESAVRRLGQAYRTQQVRRAALVAAIVASYYRTRVDVEDPQSVERWLDLLLPKIMSQHDEIARLAARYATETRRLELPKENPLSFDIVSGAVEQQVRKSMMVVGPGDYLNKARKIEKVDVDPQQKQALLIEAKQVTAQKVAASVARHTQNGGRMTLIEAAKSDKLALGYVRVTREKPCFFCAMLASRGLVFAEDSFSDSDPRFIGPGTAKVHDSCQCGMKPVYIKKTDPFLKDSEVYTDLWSEWGAGGGDAMNRFRRGYEHWLKTGEKLDWAIVDDAEKYRARTSS